MSQSAFNSPLQHRMIKCRSLHSILPSSIIRSNVEEITRRSQKSWMKLRLIPLMCCCWNSTDLVQNAHVIVSWEAVLTFRFLQAAVCLMNWIPQFLRAIVTILFQEIRIYWFANRFCSTDLDPQEWSASWSIVWWWKQCAEFFTNVARKRGYLGVTQSTDRLDV